MNPVPSAESGTKQSAMVRLQSIWPGLFTCSLLYLAIHHSNWSVPRVDQIRCWPVAAASLCAGLWLILRGIQWHLLLHLVGCPVNAGATLRLTFLNHLAQWSPTSFAASQQLKTADYARRFHYSEAKAAQSVFAENALNGLAGITLLLPATLTAPGAFAKTSAWMGLLLGLVMLWPWLTWRRRGGPFWPNLLRSRRALTLIGTAFGAAVLAQLSLLCTLGAVLQSVGIEARFEMLPGLVLMGWLAYWPIPMLGLGTRELALILHLQLWNEPIALGVTAGLICWGCLSFWAVAGAWVRSRESRTCLKPGIPSKPLTVSVIIPALNEANSLPATLEHLRQNADLQEIIVVDGGSTDGTPEVAGRLGCRVLPSAAGRGRQMRAGAALASGDVILLLHADTWVSPQAVKAIQDCLRDEGVVAGGFWKEFRESPGLLLGSKPKCAIRLWLGRRIAGDQGLFIRRPVLEKIGGVPDMALMEEFALCQRLRAEGRLALADATVRTSARRFQKLGVLRTYLRMWIVTMRYRLGTSPEELRRHYEK